MNGMAKSYGPHMLNVSWICANSTESVTSHHIAQSGKSRCPFYAIYVAFLNLLYGKSICKSARADKFAVSLSIMKLLTLGEEAELFTEAEYVFNTTDDLYGWMNISIVRNFKNEMEEVSIMEEKVGKCNNMET